MSKSKKPKSKHLTKRISAKRERKSTPFHSSDLDCPYRPGLYGTLFIEGNRDYIDKAQLIAKVAELTGKPKQSVEFAYQVLKSKSHRSNNGRSCELREGDKVKLVAVK